MYRDEFLEKLQYGLNYHMVQILLGDYVYLLQAQWTPQ